MIPFTYNGLRENRMLDGWSRRDHLKGLAVIVAGAAVSLPGRAFSQTSPIVLPDVRDEQGLSDNDALAECFRRGLNVYLPAGRGTAPDGAYQIGTHIFAADNYHQVDGNVPSGATIYGDGSFQTIIRQLDQVIFYVNSNSDDPSNNIHDVTIRDMTLYGRVESEGFAEHVHTLRLSGVSNFLAERVEFRGFQGDGVYLGSASRDIPRHNQGVTIKSCRFDGLNSNNRNGISVVDGVDWLVDGCHFENLTRPDMPGAIDVEPETTADRVARGHVTNCSFLNCGGYALGLLIGQPRTDFLFDNCKIEQCKGAFAFNGGRSADPGEAGQSFNARVQGLYVDGVNFTFFIAGAYGLEISGNTFRNGNYGFFASGSTSENVTITNNAFVNCGKDDGPVIIQDGSIINVQVTNNHVIDSGASGHVSPFYFLRSLNDVGNVQTLRLNDNTIECDNPPNRMTDIGRIVGGYTGTLHDVQKERNQVVNCTLTGPDNLVTTA